MKLGGFSAPEDMAEAEAKTSEELEREFDAQLQALEAETKVESQAAAVAIPKKIKKRKRIPFLSQVGMLVNLTQESFFETFVGLVSKDPVIRWMSFFFWLSVAGVFWVGTLAWHRVEELRSKEHSYAMSTDSTAENLAKLFEREREELAYKSSTYNLGTFFVELKAIPGSVAAPSTVNLAEIEIFLECDSKAACLFIKDNKDKARDLVTNTLLILDREELLSLEGKKKIKAELKRQFNAWLPEGRVEKLFFPKLIVD